MFSAEVLQPGWTPTISQEELNEANERLEVVHNQYRWRWLGNVITLSGSVTLHAEAHNVAAA
jgi:hypothetical protein